jgi:hypothetical protein
MSSRVPQSVESFGYHVTPAAAHPFPEIGRDLGAALGAVLPRRWVVRVHRGPLSSVGPGRLLPCFAEAA